MSGLSSHRDSKVKSLATPSLSQVFARSVNRLQLSPETIVMLLAVLIGGSTGMGVVTFHFLIHFIHHLTVESLMGLIGQWGAWTLACVPALGGAIIGLMRWLSPDFGPGISSMIAAMQKEGVAMPLVLKPVTKMVAASVSLGTGASLGPEGPSAEIGANFGMLIGQALQVSQERQRLLLGAGAAAGIAAGFNAPIAGVFFAIELVLGTSFATSAVSVVLLAAVVSALIAQIGIGAAPAFLLPQYAVRSPWELPLYMGLGLLASLVSIAYTGAIQQAQRCFAGQVVGFRWLSQIPRWVHPALGGICVGLVALQWPQIMGIGYETIEAMLQDVEFSLPLLLSLLAVKLVMTAVSLGSGLVGGTFAPSMYLGASLGAAYAKILALFIPPIAEYMAAPPAYAMVGMAAVLAGSARAPLTSIILLFELTRDYRIVLPLMAAVGLSVWLVDVLKKPTKTAASSTNLQQIGLNIQQDDNREVLDRIKVREAMNQTPLILSGTTPLLEAGLQLTQLNQHSALINNEAGRLIGILTLRDINRILSQAKNDDFLGIFLNKNIEEFCKSDIVFAYEDEPVAEALDRMRARGFHQLPVVERDNPYEALGLLNEEDVSLVCQVAMTRDVLRGFCMLPMPVMEVKKETMPV